MKLYDIDQAILNCVDPETGDIIDIEQLEQLAIAKEDKIEGLALWIKDLKAEADAIYKEERALYTRRKVAEHKAESISNFLKVYLNGQKFKTSKAVISYRTTKSIQIDDEELFVEYAKENAPDLLNVTYAASKSAIKEALESGREVRFASQVENQTITIK